MVSLCAFRFVGAFRSSTMTDTLRARLKPSVRPPGREGIMSSAKWHRVLLVVAASGLILACQGEYSPPDPGPTPALEKPSFPDPSAEVSEEVAEAIRQWVADQADENGVYDIPPRGGRDVAGTMAEFHTVHQKDADTYSVCVDFTSGEQTYDVDFFVDRTDEGLNVRNAYLHKIDGEVVSG
jgi:hypothetical protein